MHVENLIKHNSSNKAPQLLYSLGNNNHKIRDIAHVVVTGH